LWSGESGFTLSTFEIPLNPVGTLANALHITESLTQHTRHAYDCSGSYAQIERVFNAWSLCVRPFSTPAIGISTQLALPKQYDNGANLTTHSVELVCEGAGSREENKLTTT